MTAPPPETAAVPVSQTMKSALARLTKGDALTAAEVEAVFAPMMDGAADALQISALLALLAMRPATVEELFGVATVMRRHVLPIAAPENVIDTCGTGGVGSQLFNVSTTSAIVAAACGVPVAKHGNRGFTSVSGSSNFLEALGVTLQVDPDAQARSLREANICFAFAALHHPAMRHVAHVRQALGFATIFNLMGPLTNPAGARRQLVGAGSRQLAETLLQTLVRLGAVRVMVVSGADNNGRPICELSTAGPTDVALYDDGEIKTFRLMPDDVGLEMADIAALTVDGPVASAEMARGVLAGQKGPARDIVLLNSGAALWVGALADNIGQGAQKAAAAIDSGAAAETLHKWITISGGGDAPAAKSVTGL